MGKANNTQQRLKTEYIKRMYVQKGELDKTETALRDSIYNQLKELCKMYGKTIEFELPINVCNQEDCAHLIKVSKIRLSDYDGVEVYWQGYYNSSDGDWDDFTNYKTDDMSYILDRAIEGIQSLWNVKLD
jgi:hypothetical protein